MWLVWIFSVLYVALFSPVEGISRRGLLATPRPKVMAKPDYTIYLTKEQLLSAITELVDSHSDVAKVETRKASDETYSSEMMVLTISTSGFATVTNPKARLLLDFGEHGREFISSELGLRFVKLLTDPAALLAAAGSKARQQRIRRILDTVVFKILPMENVNGRSKVEGGDLCERKNGRGVDTNRNWDVDWGVKEKDYNPYEEFPGKAPFSEPEVKMIKELAESFQPHMWLNVHSGMEAMFTPYDHRAAVPEGPLPRASLRMLEVVNRHVFGDKCVVGSGGKSVGYLAHGTATDYMFEKLRVPMSYTWEIYGDFEAHFDDCFRMFNPLTKDMFEAVIAKWLQALLMLLELLPLHPAVGDVMLPHIGEAGINATLRDTMLEAGGITIAKLPAVEVGVGQGAAVAQPANATTALPDLTTTFKAAGGNPLLLAVVLIGLVGIAFFGFRYAFAGSTAKQSSRRQSGRKTPV